MDPSTLKSESDAPRKRRFVPKAPPRRVPKAEVKTEVVEDADGDQARDLLRRFNEGSMRAKPKAEKKVSEAQVAFGYGGASTTIKSYGVRKAGSSQSYQGGKIPSGTGIQVEKEYKEPWDYYSYYPTTLPLRRPYSGDPELLDEEEFRANQETITYEESLDKAAIELGLLEENPEARMFLIQLPATLPLAKRSATMDTQEVTEGSTAPGVPQATLKPCALNELLTGFMGKMLVYRSGAIKLRLGDALYNVSSGMACDFAQDVVAIDNSEKNCCMVGELSKRATITPDINSILENAEDL